MYRPGDPLGRRSVQPHPLPGPALSPGVAAVFLAVAALAATAAPAGEIRGFREAVGDRVTETTVEYRGAVRVRCDSPSGNCETETVDAAGATIEWTQTRVAESLVSTARRTGNLIALNGTRKGRPFTKTFRIDARPWLQLFPLDLESRLGGLGDGLWFWSLDPVHLLSARLLATPEGSETIEVEGRPVECRNVHVKLKGWIFLSWNTDYWYRVADGELVRRRGPGLPWLPDAELDRVR